METKEAKLQLYLYWHSITTGSRIDMELILTSALLVLAWLWIEVTIRTVGFISLLKFRYQSSTNVFSFIPISNIHYVLWILVHPYFFKGSFLINTLIDRYNVMFVLTIIIIIDLCWLKIILKKEWQLLNNPNLT